MLLYYIFTCITFYLLNINIILFPFVIDGLLSSFNFIISYSCEITKSQIIKKYNNLFKYNTITRNIYYILISILYLHIKIFIYNVHVVADYIFIVVFTPNISNKLIHYFYPYILTIKNKMEDYIRLLASQLLAKYIKEIGENILEEKYFITKEDIYFSLFSDQSLFRKSIYECLKGLFIIYGCILLKHYYATIYKIFINNLFKFTYGKVHDEKNTLKNIYINKNWNILLEPKILKIICNLYKPSKYNFQLELNFKIIKIISLWTISYYINYLIYPICIMINVYDWYKYKYEIEYYQYFYILISIILGYLINPLIFIIICVNISWIKINIFNIRFNIPSKLIYNKIDKLKILFKILIYYSINKYYYAPFHLIIPVLFCQMDIIIVVLLSIYFTNYNLFHLFYFSIIYTTFKPNEQNKLILSNYF